MKKPTESDTLRGCLECLAAHRITAWRTNNAGVRRRDRSGREFWAFTGVRGMSDILGILPICGRLLAVETKSATGRLTEEQTFFLDLIRANGGLAIVARSPGELHDALTAEGY